VHPNVPGPAREEHASSQSDIVDMPCVNTSPGGPGTAFHCFTTVYPWSDDPVLNAGGRCADASTTTTSRSERRS
jgi:hypothetical protein